MTPEERFAHIEQTLAETVEIQKDSAKRHEDFRRNHESWVQDHERWMRDQERIDESFKAEMRLTLKSLAASQALTDFKLQALAASQALTDFKLQALIDLMRNGGQGRPPQ